MKISLSRPDITEKRDRCGGGIGCRPYFTPIHLQPFYREMFGYKPCDFPVTERIASSTISLPFHNNLPDEEIDYVVEKVREGIRNSGG